MYFVDIELVEIFDVVDCFDFVVELVYGKVDVVCCQGGDCCCDEQYVGVEDDEQVDEINLYCGCDWLQGVIDGDYVECFVGLGDVVVVQVFGCDVDWKEIVQLLIVLFDVCLVVGQQFVDIFWVGG